MTVLALFLLGGVTITSYRAVPSQTDSTPNLTATGEHVTLGGIAASQDLLCGHKSPGHSRGACLKSLHYGDHVYVEGFGIFRVNDCMNARHRMAVDIFVRTKSEERQIGTRRGRLWGIEPRCKECR